MPYGQEGQQATVYQLVSGTDLRALKVFKPRFRLPALVTLSSNLLPFVQLPGLQACRRIVLRAFQHAELLQRHPDLTYAVLMPWIDGPTWLEVLLAKQVLSPTQSLCLARSLAIALTTMEERGLAHCDLSGPNVMLPALAGPEQEKASAIELVDVEQFYGPGLTRPQILIGGSAGYAYRTAEEGHWSSEADRFAGAVLLAEILGWSDPRVRAAAWGESYFEPDEMQQSCNRYHLLTSVVANSWGEGLSQLYQRAWWSETLADCATFGEWLVALPSETVCVSPQEPSEVLIPSPPERVGEPEEAASLSPERDPLEEKEQEAVALERAEKWKEAAEAYRWLLTQAPRHERSCRWRIAWDRCQKEIELAVLFDDGLAYYFRGKWGSARELLGEALRRQPDYRRKGQRAETLLQRMQEIESPEEGPVQWRRWTVPGAAGLLVISVLVVVLLWPSRLIDPPVPTATFTTTLTYALTSTPSITVMPTPTHIATPKPTATSKPTATRTPTAAHTQTPSRTPRPSATPTPTMDADPTIYDNFDDPRFDDSYNFYLWQRNAGSAADIRQQGGVLVLSHVPQTSRDTTGLTVQRTFLAGELSYFESEIMLQEASTSGNVHMHLSSDELGWWTQCNIHRYSSIDVWARCIATTWPTNQGFDYQTEPIETKMGAWHKVRIVIAPDTFELKFYIDGQYVGSHTPKESAQLKKSGLKLSVECWSQDGPIVGQVDNVRIVTE